jgi:hypothetical protein
MCGMFTRLVCLFVTGFACAQTNPLWHEEKVRNYLPHMTWPEVQDLLTRTDMVIIPVASLEEHGPQTPIGTDYLSGVERAKLIAQKTDVLVAPIVLPGISPYHMEFPGTITLSHDTLQRVYFEAAQSLIHHGFRRILFLNSHAGNQYLTMYIADRIQSGDGGDRGGVGECGWRREGWTFHNDSIRPACGGWGDFGGDVPVSESGGFVEGGEERFDTAGSFE